MTKLIRPMTLGALFQPFTSAGVPHLAVAAVGFFELGPPRQRFVQEAAQWPKVLGALPHSTPLDLIVPKAKGEWWLVGDAASPAGVPVPSLDVTVTIGSSTKSLHVVGNRTWRFALSPSLAVDGPEPFVRMPIDRAHAFGGPDFERNPVGLGQRSAFSRATSGSLPNVMTEADEVVSPRREGPVATFAPLAVDSPERAAFVERLPRRMKDPQDAPDTDPRFYQSACVDQWIDGVFRGGEPIELSGFGPRIESAVPAYRVVVMPTFRDGADVLEAGALDTIGLFPGLGIGCAIYRTILEIGDIDGRDVETLLVGYEAFEEKPRGIDHYRSVREAYANPTDAVAAALDESLLAPADDGAWRLAARREERGARASRRKAFDELLDAPAGNGSAALPDQLDSGIEALRVAKPSQAEVEHGDVDLEPLLGAVDALVEQVSAFSDDAMKSVPTPVSEKALTSSEIKAAIDAATSAAAIRYEQEEFDGTGPVALDRAARRQRGTASEPAPVEAVSKALRAVLIEALNNGDSLVGRDFTGVDASDLNFTGKVLRHAVFENACLDGARLTGADATGMILTGASATRTDFSDATLDRANLSSVRGAGAVFRDARLVEAKLNGARFQHGTFDGANLTRCVGQNARFDDASFNRASVVRTTLLHLEARRSTWHEAVFDSAILIGANLDDASFDGASMERTVCVEIESARSCWKGAVLRRTPFNKAALVSAVFDDADVEQACFREVDFTAASLARARFVRSDVGDATLIDVDASGAWFLQSNLLGASFVRANLDGADLFGAIARQVDFREASLVEANFGQAETTGASFADAIFDDTTAPSLERVSEAWR